MVDRLFADPAMARWYDVACPWEPRGDFEFYLPYALDAGSVLDVGCGTGTFLRGVRDRGHRGRLVGVDPAAAMLDRARERDDVEWVLGEMPAHLWAGEFDLAVMTGHAFQVLLTDEATTELLRSVHGALGPGGRFAFETRNPGARAWERWTPEHATELSDAGERVRSVHQVRDVAGDLVTFTETLVPAHGEAMVSTSTLRFVAVDTLDRLLADAGFAIERRYGDFGGAAMSPTSPEIITIARRT